MFALTYALGGQRWWPRYPYAHEAGSGWVFGDYRITRLLLWAIR